MGIKLNWTGLFIALVLPALIPGLPLLVVGAIIMLIGIVLTWLDK